MHRYFFDLEAGPWDARDDVGVVLADAGAAHAEAIQGLHSCAGATLPLGAGPDLAMTVRDETGQTVLRISLSAARAAVAARGGGRPMQG
ncbi:hypothetical protein OPKNFCMD_3482 [Methylobacterium crusticola]|uniref:DUF6894 domain-containing protein n=1 Tax=Methylobacterium crusticola TaxID=1697972 RepID=A0ABQ4R1S9_9HYPH|nr:hypothetical protein [Methylobacterium crusticola]GJD50737.1 hypothetical protein OPKNFCMD_3482 [Methylobacterium crusticola]